MNSPEAYYKESGKIGAIGIPAMLVVGIIASLVIGGIYAYATFYIPFIYLNFFLTIFLGIAVGYVVGKVGYFSKVRNGTVMVIIGIIIGLIAVYCAWVFWIHALFEQAFLSFAPDVVFTTMGLLAEEGAWTIFGATPSGIFLYIIWLIEAAIVVVASVIFTLAGFGPEPYCEDCNTWTKSEVITTHLEPISNTPGFVSALEGGNVAELTRLKNVNPVASKRSKVDLLNCPNCGKSHFLSVEDVLTTLNDKGEPEEETSFIVSNLILSEEAFGQINAWKNNIGVLEAGTQSPNMGVPGVD